MGRPGHTGPALFSCGTHPIRTVTARTARC